MTFLILSRHTVAKAIADAEAGRKQEKGEEQETPPEESKPADFNELEKRKGFSLIDWLKNHPLTDVKFSFFIFALIPVQTLFAHNWLTLPMYVERAYRESWALDQPQLRASRQF